ncbi:NSFL1 cofactor p47 [Trichinella murrelli]|uniref:NSFL1 cofactor p47 n=1 Tax=Trichinella murrelli TaxID=144512 RepID=A0A0V0UEE9_9BILA|nr:NSFL1 cofactor p47 [Trichinella murrelli]
MKTFSTALHIRNCVYNNTKGRPILVQLSKRSLSNEVISLHRFNFLPFDVMQDLLISIHENCSLPWWACIAGCTVLAKAATFPLMVISQRNSARCALAAPQIEKMLKDLQSKVDEEAFRYSWPTKRKNIVYRLNANRIVREIYSKYDFHPGRSYALAYAQFPLWITLSMSIRSIAEPSLLNEGTKTYLGMHEGGLFWFKDLTIPDSTLALPVLLGICNYAIFKLHMPVINKVTPTMKSRACIAFGICMSFVLPVISALTPSALGYFWLLSSTSTLIMYVIVKQRKLKKLYGIPPLPFDSKNPFSDMFAMSQLIEDFLSVTGTTDQEVAKFFLESSDWNLEVAVQNYFEGNDEDSDLFNVSETALAASPARLTELDSEEEFVANSENKVINPTNVADSSPEMSRKFATLFDKDKKSGRSSDSDDEQQPFYVGGGHKSDFSGQQVLGPKPDGAHHIVEHMIEKLKKHGAEVVNKQEEAASSQQSKFVGPGFRLNSSSETPQNPSPPENNEINVILRMWQNGFTVDDGPLRKYEGNESFLNDVMNGKMPEELVKSHHNRYITLDFEDRRMESFKPPARPRNPFSGEGHMVGSYVPAVNTGKGNEQVADVANVVAKPVDESKPTTTVVVRLLDGSRAQFRVNVDNTIEDLRAHICKSRPEYVSENFVLMTSFPCAKLDDETKTIEELHLENAVLLQRRMTSKELVKFLGIDKLINAWNIIKQNGGIWRSLVMAYRTDTVKGGNLIGIDENGNRYYENNSLYVPRNRWVVYSRKVWLNYDASQISAEWQVAVEMFNWLHHQTDIPPTVERVKQRSWMLPHVENMSGTEKRFITYSTTRTKIEAWVPTTKKTM